MSNLLSANFIRLRKNKCFWGCFLFMAAAAVYVPVMRCISVANSGYKERLDNGFFSVLFLSLSLSLYSAASLPARNTVTARSAIN